MREYIFRGRDFFGKWHEGYLSGRGELVKIAPKSEYWVDYYVKPETVGQYINRTDKNGKNVFDGDIVRWTRETDEEIIEEEYLVKWDDELCAFVAYRFVYDERRFIWSKETFSEEIEVIGNRFDNPELLGVLK